MKKPLNIKFCNPNFEIETEDALIKLFLEVNRKKVEDAIKAKLTVKNNENYEIKK